MRHLHLTALISLLTMPAFAQQNAYHITEQEKAACTADAERLCSSAYPDENKLLTCMKAAQAQLTPSCSVVFRAGLKRRHIALD